MNIIEHIRQQKIIAIVRLDDLSKAVDLAQALIAGGVNIIEFTLTNPDAAQTIAKVRDMVGDTALIGAGSVISAEQVTQVADCGAQFIVSPVTKKDVIEACHKHQLPTFPGAYTPTEIQNAWEMDVTAVKVFPATQLGSSFIKDVLAPLPHLRLVPTGGINADNIADFITKGAFAVGIGGALCDKEAIANNDWQSIIASARGLRKALAQ